MNQRTFELMDVHAQDCEFEQVRSFRSAPRPERRRPRTFRKRRSAPFSMNGRNNARSTSWSMKRAQLAVGV